MQITPLSPVRRSPSSTVAAHETWQLQRFGGNGWLVACGRSDPAGF
jgi:hypothetical protein